MRGWLTGQIQARKEMAFNNAARSLEDAFAFAGARGEIAGIELAMKWPDIMLESTKREIEATLAQLRAEEEDVEEENGTTE